MRVAAAGETGASESRALLARVLDEVIERAGAGPGHDAAAEARRRFEARRGRVAQDEELWETWTQSFLEWYALEDEEDGEAGPPAARELAREADPRRAEALRAWLRSHRTIARVRALRPGRAELDDVLGGAAFSVAEKRRLHGVAAGDLAELRLVGFEGAIHFGRAFCFHPPGAEGPIARLAEALYASGGSRRDVMDTCAEIRARSEHYRHVDPVRLYERAAAAPRPGDRA